jgi:YbbR domain-containing protein
MRYDYTIVRMIPVILENEKEGQALQFPVPKNMTVRFHGNGWMLAALALSPDMKYYIDVSSLSREHYVVTAQDVLEHIKLPVSVQVMDVKPETLILALDEYKEKRVPIVSKVMMNFHEGYGQVGSVTILPESVLIGGTKHIIDQLTEWPTVYKKLDDLRGPVDMELLLEESATYAVNIAQPSARITVNVQPFAEKVFPGIPISVVSLPSNREVIFIPPRMDVIARGGIDQLAKLTPESFEATVHYQTLVEDTTNNILPVLQGPGGVKIVSRKPERFQFIIRTRL